MVLSKENREITALSGQAGFGSAKPDFECDIRSADVLDGSSLQLRGTVQATGSYTKSVYFNGSAYSMIDQITIEYNGQPVLNLTSDADYVAQMNRVLHSSYTQFENDDVLALASKDVKQAPLSFVLDLSKYGSALKYFLITSPVASLKVRIHFQTDLARVFYANGGADGANVVSGYTLNNLRLCGDFMKFESSAQSALIKRLQSPTGMKMVCHSFIPQRNQLIPTALNHRIQGSYQYRNLVSAFYLPVPTTITTKVAGIAENDIISIIRYNESNYPLNMRVRLSGMNYVNQNGTSGCSQKMEHLTGVMKSALRTPEENNTARELFDGYLADSYQITGVSFVRGNDNLVAITNSGANGFASRGILETEFDTASAQANITLLTIGVVSTVVSVENGQVSVLR